MMRNRTLLATCALLLLAACAVPADGQKMRINADVVEHLRLNPALKDKVRLGTVVTREGLGNSGVSITADAFSAGLRDSLRDAGYYARGSKPATYLLDATIREASLPELGFDVEMNTVVEYQLVRVKNQSVVWRDTVTIPYVEPFSTSFNAQERMSLAASHGLRENITHMVRLLSEASIR